MSTHDNDSFIAMPPPGAPVEDTKTDVASAAPSDAVEYISLPPGIALDSGTFKVPARTPAARESAPEIVFVPTVIGAAPVLPDVGPEPAPVAEPIETPVAETPAPPTAPVAVAPPAPSPAPVWRLVLPEGGATVALDASVLIGRNPAASADRPQATLLPVSDLTKSVSKTHALLEIDEGALWVHDLDSTNGVYVVVGDDVTEVVPGTRVVVPADSDLELGEFVMRVTLE